MKTYTPTQLREDLYNILDQVAETERPIEIKTKKSVLTIVPKYSKKLSRFGRLKKRNIIIGDPEDLVHVDWSHYWKPGRF